MTITTLKSEGLESAATLFERYPYKTVQRMAQKLPQDRLVSFYTSNLARDLEAGRKRWIARDGPEVSAMAGFNDDPYHSKIYGLNMAKVAPWLVLPESGESPELWDAVETHARTRGVQHLSVRLDGEDYPSLHFFEGRGFHLIDVSLKFFLPFSASVEPIRLESPRSGWSIRKMRGADSPWMIALGGGGHGQNHFLNDPALNPEATRNLFGSWVRRCIEGLAYTIYVIEDPSGQGRGFVIYLRSKSFAQAVGRNPLILDYVVLDPKVRGGGLGPWLIQDSLERERGQGFDYCELRTSQHNHRAVIGYEKLGFRLCASDFILHRKLQA
jgi:GNAT superfamily N-acetyltransferase